MSACKFELGKRVTVPGVKVQGIIVERSESMVNEPRYILQWLGDDLKTLRSDFGEAQIVAAEAEFREGLETAAVRRLGIVAARETKRRARR